MESARKSASTAQQSGPKLPPLATWGFGLLFYLGLPVALAVVVYMQPLLAVTVPANFLPTFLFFGWHSRQPGGDKTSTEALVWTYVLTGTVGMAAVMAMQAIVTYILALMLFGSDLDAYAKEANRREADLATLGPDDLAKRLAMARHWKYWTASFLMCFVVAGFMEEVMKYTVVVLARHYYYFNSNNNNNNNYYDGENAGTTTRTEQPPGYIPLSIAATLGFSTVEGLLFVCVDTFKYTAGKLSLARLALTMCERTVVGAQGHALTAALAGVDLVQTASACGAGASPSWWTGLHQAVLLPALFHGAFDFALVSISTWHGHIGWVHPRGRSLYLAAVVALSIQASLAILVWRKVSHLESLGMFKTA